MRRWNWDGKEVPMSAGLRKKYKGNPERLRSLQIVRTLSICVVPLDCVLMMGD